MDSWKAEVRRVRRDKIRRKKMQMREKVGKSRNTVFFQWFEAPEGRKVGSLKRRVRSQLARWDMKKVHAVVARSTFPSQNGQNTRGADHFWKLRCRKSARRCGAKHILEGKMHKNTPFSEALFGSWDVEKSARRCGARHISKWKCTKHTILGALFGSWDVEKSARRLWREAHFEVKSVKNWRSRTTFGGSDVEKVSKKCTPLWREAHFEVKSVKNWGFWNVFDVKMSKK